MTDERLATPLEEATSTGSNAKIGKIPSSEARVAFKANSADIVAYFSLHQLAFKGATRAIRHYAYIVDKAIYVLVASLWEAYCEDVVTESINHLVAHAPTYNSIQPSLIKDIEKSIRNGQVSPWTLAGDGWRQYIKDRRDGFERKRNKEFASPKSDSVEQFFRDVLGIEELREVWKVSGWPTICDELDAHLERRNTVIHRITPGRILYKRDVKNFYKIVRLLVAYTDQTVDAMLRGATGQSRWTSYVAVDPYDKSK